MFAALKKKEIKYVVILLICILSCIIRRPDFETTIWKSSDTNYQVLMNIKAMIDADDSFVRITFDEIEDYGVEYSSGAFDRENREIFYYVSFPRFPFIFLMIVFKVFSLETTVVNLYYVTSILFCIATLSTVYMFDKLFGVKMKNIDVAWIVAILFMFSTEIMHSQGLTYWGHSWYMIAFPLYVLLVNSIMQVELKKSQFIGIVLLSFFMLQTEWSGYFAVFGVAILLLIKFSKKSKTHYRLGLLLLFECFISAVGYILINSYLVGPRTFVKTMMQRFTGRTRLTDYGLLYWGEAVMESFGLLIILSLLFIIWSLCRRKKLLSIIKENKEFVFIVSFPFFENIVFTNHTLTYSMDRMKWIYIILFMFLIALDALCDNRDCKILTNYICAIGVAMNFIGYIGLDNSYLYKDERLLSNQYIVDEIAEYKEDAVFGQLGDGAVWGHTKILVGHGVEKQTSMKEIVEKAIRFQKRYAIAMIGSELGYAQKCYSTVIIYDTLTEVYSIKGLLSGEYQECYDGLYYLKYADYVEMNSEEEKIVLTFEKDDSLEDKVKQIEEWCLMKKLDFNKVTYKTEVYQVPQCIQLVDVTAGEFVDGTSISRNFVIISNTEGNRSVLESARIFWTSNASFEVLDTYIDGYSIYYTLSPIDGSNIEELRYPATIEIQ